jgi:hypothetical protein
VRFLVFSRWEAQTWMQVVFCSCPIRIQEQVLKSVVCLDIQAVVFEVAWPCPRQFQALVLLLVAVADIQGVVL